MRMNKALKDRTETLRSEIDRYLAAELRSLNALKENLDLELMNIQSNCDISDKYMTDNIEWDDCELMDTKEIFLKTVEFLRNFEYETADYNRRVRFLMMEDINQLVMKVANYGDLNITPHPATGSQNSGNSLAPPPGPGLMRSKSDHRLASQFRQQQEERGIRDEDEPVLGGRKFGERHASNRATDRYSGDGTTGSNRYGRSSGNDYDYGNEYDEPPSRASKTRFRSRFVRSHQQDDNSDNEQGRNVRFNEKEKEKERERVIDTEDVARGHLSGIIRLTDSPRVMKRLQEQERGKKEKKEIVAPAPVAAKAVFTKRSGANAAAPAATRQMSEDEIDRIKRQNKGAATSAAAAAAATTTGTAIGLHTEPERPTTERVSALKTTSTSSRAGSSVASEESGGDSLPSSPVRRTPPTQVEVRYDNNIDDC